MKLAKAKPKQPANHTHTPAPIGTIVLILALPEERGYLHDVIACRPDWTASDPRGRFVCSYKSARGTVNVIVHTLPAMGNIEAALLAGAGIAQANPELVILVGLAGSMNPSEVQLGDVVISNQAKLYSSDKVKALSPPSGPETRHYRFNDERSNGGDEIVIDRRDALMSKSFLRYERRYVESKQTDQLISELQLKLRPGAKSLLRVNPDFVPSAYRTGYISRGSIKIHSGWILASQHVVDSAEYRDYLNEKNKDQKLDVHRQTGEQGRCQWTNGELLAVDMESYGLLRAVELLRTTHAKYGGAPNLHGAIVVRGISDLSEEKAESDGKSGNETRRVAVYNATEITLRIIEGIDYDDLRP